ncbi:MAG: NAD(P)H-dependent oxidoreductase [Magnetovibrionaceae bacterium]
MKVFCVSAHPEPKSFNTALLKRGLDQLRRNGHEVDHSDLYAMAFNPVASADDFQSRTDPDYLVYALEQRQNFKAGTLASDISGEVEKLIRCDLLILHFPLYWFSVPAILKGWIDRVMISGLTYGGRRFYDQGGLKGRKALLTFTLGGREHMFGPDSIHGPIEDMLRPLIRGSLHYVGLEVLDPFIGWHVPYISDEARAAILDDYAARLGKIETEEGIGPPSLAGFDETFNPIRRSD